MAKKDKRIDDYIGKSAPFAQPILKHIRKLVHEACPEVEETWKWSFPHFDYKGEMMCSMAAFKQHAVFGFWKAKLLKDPKGFLSERKNNGGEAMGHGGKLLTLKDLPPDKVFIDFVKQAVKLNDKGVKVDLGRKPAITKKLTTPPYFLTALKKNKKAIKVWEEWTPGKQKEYIDWLVGAKTEETRNKRMAQAIEWIAEGKIRNWKYVGK